MTKPYVLHEKPDFYEPRLILALEGWVDAGMGMVAASELIVHQCEPDVIATFDSDTFIDYRARRPALTLVDGVNESLQWPEIELLGGRDLDSNGFYMLRGHEPDSNWWQFLAAVQALCEELNIAKVVTIGAYPAAVPHTRDTPLTVTGTTSAHVDPKTAVPGRIELPAGVTAAIERNAADHGIPAIGIWAQVPHYAAALAYPAATKALVIGLREHANVMFIEDELLRSVEASRSQLDDLIAQSDERGALLEELERMHDETGLGSDLPSGDQLAEELQDFLRDLDTDK